MTWFGRLRVSLGISFWFMFLTFPIMVVRVNTIEKTIDWRWDNLLYVGVGSFFLSLLWRYLLERKNRGRTTSTEGAVRDSAFHHWWSHVQEDPRKRRILATVVIGAVCLFPLLPFLSTYQINIMANALLYVMLGLGLNIVVGLAGLLHLGYVAFYAVGAYTYALLYHHFGIGFWTALPLGALLATLFGVLLGFPILRLRGDYLAIVTLGFGEITRLILENWNEFSFGPSGIAGIPRPGLFGLELDLHQATIYIYYLMFGLCVLTVFIVGRLQHSRIGRAWMALREDEIACESVGVDARMAKLSAFALGSTWAGLAGVVFAAKTTFVNPASFTFLESAMILSIVVLGGMGSIVGIILAALILILTPEYLRAFSEYRMLIFGTIMVMMMVFRPQGIVSGVRRTYTYSGKVERT